MLTLKPHTYRQVLFFLESGPKAQRLYFKCSEPEGLGHYVIFSLTQRQQVAR